MKVLKCMALSMCIFMAFQSCSESNDELMMVASHQNAMTKSIDVERGYDITDDGVLRFESIDAYYSLSDSLRQLTEDEFESWEKEVGFSSYRTFFKNILLSAMEMDTDARNGFVNSNSDCVYIDSNDLIQPVVGAQFFRNVINQSRCFYIADNKYIVDSDFVVTEDQMSKSIKDKVRYTLMSNEVSVLAGGDEISYPTIEYVLGRGDYKVMTWFRIYRNVFESPFTGKFNQLLLEVSVRPRKFINISGYKDYNDMCYVDEMKIHMPGLGTGIFVDETGSITAAEDQRMFLTTASSTKSTPLYTSSYVIWESKTQVFPTPLQDPICVHYRARTGNTGKYGAAYNTYHPLPGMSKDDCGHREVTEYQHIVY